MAEQQIQRKPRYVGVPDRVMRWREAYENFLRNQASGSAIGKDFYEVLLKHNDAWEEYFRESFSEGKWGTLVFSPREEAQAEALQIKSAALMATFEQVTGETVRGVVSSKPLKKYHMAAPWLSSLAGFGVGFGLVRK